MKQVKKPVIFCDFDGTITEKDNIIAIVEHFNPPGWETIVNDIVARRKTIREGVGQLFNLLPTSRKDEIIHFAISNVRIRSGFKELLAYVENKEIPFYVTSGGIDFFIYAILKPFGILEENIYCNHSDFSGETIQILWPNACDEHCQNDCGMCKPRIIRNYAEDEYERILIGDSVTDFAGAKLAHFVYARSHLLEECRREKIPCVPFEDFHTVVADLQKRYDI